MRVFKRLVLFTCLTLILLPVLAAVIGIKSDNSYPFLFVVNLIFLEILIGGYIYLSRPAYIKLICATGLQLGAWLYLANYPQGGYPGMNIGLMGLILLFVIFPCFVYIIYAVARLPNEPARQPLKNRPNRPK